MWCVVMLFWMGRCLAGVVHPPVLGPDGVAWVLAEVDEGVALYAATEEGDVRCVGSWAAARAPVAIAALGGGGVVLVRPGSGGHEVVLRSAEGTERPVLRGLPGGLRYRLVAHPVAPRVAVEGVDADGATRVWLLDAITGRTVWALDERGDA